MKNILKKIASLVLGSLMLASPLSAATILFPGGGGTGWGTPGGIKAGYLMYGNGLSPISTSSLLSFFNSVLSFSYSSSTVYSSFITASTTNLTAGTVSLATSTTGCVNGNTTATGITTLYLTGTACGTGSGGTSAFEIATDTAITAPGFAYFEKTSGRTTLGSISSSTLSQILFPNTSYGASSSTIFGFTGGLFSTASSTFGSNTYFPSLTQGYAFIGSNGLLSTNSTSTLVSQIFTFTSYGVSSSSVFGLLGGYFSTASSTQSGNFFLPALTQGFLYTGTNGKVNTVASSSINISSLNNDLANLTATNASLTFSGSYNGSVARTVGINLGNTNTWTILQNFNYSSSTIYSSFVTASTTFLNLGVPQGYLYVGSSQSVQSAATSSETCTAPLSCTSFDVLKNGGAITLTAPLTVAQGGTNNTATYAINSLMSSDSAGTKIIATTSEITLGSVLATSTTKDSIYLNNRFAIGTTTPKYQLTLASSTAPQLYMGDGTAGLAGWVWRVAGTDLFLASTTAAGTATTSTAAMRVRNTDSCGRCITVGTTTPMATLKNGSISLGGGGDAQGNTGSTTISAAKIQFDGMSSNGTRVCVFVNNASALVVVAGACTP